MRRLAAVLAAAGSLFLGVAAASPAMAAKSPPPIQLLCSQTLMGATLVNGVCVLPSPSPVGVANDYIQPLAVSNPNGGDTFFKVISGTVPPGLSVLPQYGYEAFIITSHESGGTFEIACGSLPPGLSMPASYGAAGTIVVGQPTQQGTFTFTVQGTDGQGEPLKQAYSIRVDPPLPLAINPPASGFTLLSGTVGQSYAQGIFATGGGPPTPCR